MTTPIREEIDLRLKLGETFEREHQQVYSNALQAHNSAQEHGHRFLLLITAILALAIPGAAATSMVHLGWVEQIGGAHEDWELDQSLIASVNVPGVFVSSGLRVSHHNLISIAKNVSNSAKALLRDVETLKQIKRLSEPKSERSS